MADSTLIVQWLSIELQETYVEHCRSNRLANPEAY